MFQQERPENCRNFSPELELREYIRVIRISGLEFLLTVNFRTGVIAKTGYPNRKLAFSRL